LPSLERIGLKPLKPDLIGVEEAVLSNFPNKYP
jgi:hypothetical protein